ncbi:nuclear transport factor 2 family protein [[Mannheimia] succiniciproducens]|uniref:DUF4440 domain-containing protein n=1 Tax=Mannheimia succiniciproducens (strain KCTC 0769BP / MBEL55E) TaxID=221988 RepID=Q65SQ4_MANSM|nr:nuclear transport factor 2 family protein [[Mannheimia] succiniciproducens]AAU38006.1 unknown [[Mannheimia] succiniciproducens MBEL55E]
MNSEQTQLVEHIISLEKQALDKWFKGDTSGYRELWSKQNFSYFDIVHPERIDSYDNISAFLDSIEGKLFADSYEFKMPRVQLSQDMAILTYQIFAKTNLIDMRYNCIEVFQKEGDEWKVVHSTWSAIRPMDWDFSTMKAAI